MALLVDPTDVWLLAEDIELFESLVITDAVETIFPMQMMMIMIESYDNNNNYNGDNYNDMMIMMEIVMMMRTITIINYQ